MEENEGFTFEQALHSIWKHILIVVGATLLLTLAAVLIFIFAINPNKIEYSLNFTLTYPTSQSMKYPDGTPFNYRDMTSVAYLSEAKASDERFANIDILKLVAEDDIDIDADVQEKSGQSSFTGKYTVTVKGSYFSDKAVATDFLRAIAEVPVNHIKAMAAEVDYTLDQATFENASFADRLTLLSEQKKSLIAQYDEWIDLYSEKYIAANKTLKNLRAEAITVFGDGTMKSLSEDLEKYGYVKPESIAARKVELQEERALNTKKIEALLAASENTGISGTESYSLRAATKAEDEGQTVITVSPDPSPSTLLGNLIVRNEQIDFQLEKLTEANVTSFQTRVDAQFEALNNAAKTITTVAGSIYTQQSTIIFTTSKAEVDGDSSTILVAVASLIVSFLVVSCIVCIYDAIKKKKPEQIPSEKSVPMAPQPAAAPVTAQTPSTAEKILARVSEPPKSEFEANGEIPIEPLYGEDE